MRKLILKWEKYKLSVVFLISIMFISSYYRNIDSMVNLSGDANDIWKTITSYYSEDIYPSYVLYKGFLSVYPYVWFYKFSELLNVDSFLFIKIYYASCYIYITLIGLPYIISFLIDKPISFSKRMILFTILFFLWEYTKILSQFMIDLPNLTYFIIGVNLTIFIYNEIYNKRWYHFVLAGIFTSAASTLTGQYFVASLIVIIFTIGTILKKTNNTKNRFIAVFLIIIGVIIPIATDETFNRSIVYPMKVEGAWIPSAEDWMNYTSILCIKEYMIITDQMDSPRGKAIIYEYAGGSAKSIINQIDSGGVPYDKSDYLKMFFAHPVDFIIIWINKLFLLLSFDNGNLNVFHLVISYTSIFWGISLFFRNIENVFNPKAVVIMAFIFTALPVSLAQVENRYGIALHGLLIAYLICSSNIKFRKLKEVFVKDSFQNKKIYLCKETKQYILLYILFIIFCFIHIGVLYELSSRSNILFKFIN